MSFPVERPGQVDQGAYWVFFGATMILIPGLLVGGGAAMLHGSLGTGLLMVAAIVPIGLYWRVIMMRRCRDIGWPAFLPWLFFGLVSVASYSAMHRLHGVRYGAAPSLSVLSIPLVMGFADFALSIVIGCVRSKEPFDYAAALREASQSYQSKPSSQPSQPLGSSPSTPLPEHSAARAEGGDRYDEAIARALEAHRRRESLAGASAPRPSPEPTRPAGGFGRRIA